MSGKQQMTTGEVLIWGIVWLLFLWPVGGFLILIATSALTNLLGPLAVLLGLGAVIWLVAFPFIHGIQRSRNPREGG